MGIWRESKVNNRGNWPLIETMPWTEWDGGGDGTWVVKTWTLSGNFILVIWPPKKDAFLCHSLSHEEGQGGRLGGGVSPRLFPVCVCLGECIICGVMPDVQLSHGSQAEVTKQTTDTRCSLTRQNQDLLQTQGSGRRDFALYCLLWPPKAPLPCSHYISSICALHLYKTVSFFCDCACTWVKDDDSALSSFISCQQQQGYLDCWSLHDCTCCESVYRTSFLITSIYCSTLLWHQYYLLLSSWVERTAPEKTFLTL